MAIEAAAAVGDTDVAVLPDPSGASRLSDTGAGDNAAVRPANSSALRLPDVHRYGIRIWSGFSLVVVAVLVMGGASYQSIAQNRELAHKRQVIENLWGIVSDVKGMMLGEFGYAVTLNDRYVNSTWTESEQLTKRLATLHRLITDEQDQLSSLERIEAAIVQLRGFAFETIATRRSQGLQAVAAMIATGQGESATEDIEDIEEQLRAMAAYQGQLLAAGIRTADMTGAQTLRVVAAASLLALICAGFSGWFTRSSLNALRASSAELVRSHSQLQVLNKELKRSNGELEQFAYSASHDLQEPLRMVASYLQLIRDRYRSRLDADADDFIDFAVDGAARMKLLINDLLVYSRAGRGSAPRLVESEQALAWAVSNLSLRIGESGAAITHGPLPLVVADPTQLSEVFQNLVENALKFHGDGPPQITVNASISNGEWLFSVKDNGIGISPEHRDRIFQMFQRLHGRDEYSGTGIGLAVCRKIIERHGGLIWVESEEGAGADFRFTMSAAPAETHLSEASI